MTATQHDDLGLATQLQHCDPFQAIVPMFPAGCGTYDCSPRMPLSAVAGAVGDYHAIASGIRRLYTR